MNVRIEESWREKLQSEFDAPYFAQLTDFVRHEYATTRVYPPGSQMFAAFDACPFDKVKVVILGQDPYHEPGQAHGLCFSVNDGVPFPPSLQNIFKEIHDDIGTPVPMSGDLSRWAHQGVLLLNLSLSSGGRMPSAKASLSTAPATWCCSRLTRRPSRRIGDFSETAISAAPTNISWLTASNLFYGNCIWKKLM